MDESHHLMGVWSQLQAAVPLRGVERRTAELSWAVTCCQPGSWHISAGNLTGKRREFTQCNHMYTLQWSRQEPDSSLIQYLAYAHVQLLYIHEQTQTGTTDLHYYNHSHVKSTQRRPHNNHSPLIVSVHIHSSSPAFRFLYLNKRLTPLFPVTFTDLESDWRNW